MGKSLQLNCTRAKVLYINPCMAGVVRKLMPIAVTGGVVLLGWGLMLLAQQLRHKYCLLTERANQTYITAPESSFLPHISQGVYPILAELR